MLSAQEICAQLIYETVWVDHDSAWEYKNIQFIPIRPREREGKPRSRIISLSHALQTGKATVSERGTASTENVHWLRINNRSTESIFVASGQTFSGGRQDRMVTKDTILSPAGKDQYIPVMCIEEGRWSEKEKKLQYDQYANIQLRKVLDRTKNQVLIWKEIFSQLSAASLSSSTFAYSALKQKKDYLGAEKEYLDHLRQMIRNSDSTMTGFICVSGDRVIGCEIFADRDLFFEELEPLLYGYISEAIMYGRPPILVKEQVKEFTDKILTNETMQSEYCKTNGKIFRADSKVFKVTAYQ
jgi:hypothetical protein